MADNQEDRSREDLTEEASPQRLQEFREKGQVAQSKEITGLIALLAAGATAYAMSPKIGAELAEFMKEVFRTDLSARLDLGGTHVMHDLFLRALYVMGGIGVPVCVAGFVFGVISSFSQVGAVFSWDPVTPDFSKINPISGIQRMISLRQGVEALRLIFKMCVVVAVAYSLVKSEVLRSPSYVGVEPSALAGIAGRAAKTIFLSLVGILAIFAGIDFFFQRREYDKNLRMTKQEAKQEHKEREGDPAIKARVRAVQREIARRRMMAAIKTADVIVTNPTHIAIAIKYDREKMNAPVVVAKGADFMAQKIKKIAADAGVPLVENVPLARTLFKTVKLNHPVPRALFQAVAEVLAYVYRLKNRSF